MVTNRRMLVLLCALVLGSLLVVAPRADALPTMRAIHFPVEGEVHFRDDFGAPRIGHTHQGNDLMGDRLQPLLSAVDGTVTTMQVDRGGTGGNYLFIRDAAGWTYRYLHINNDTPGTDDGANPPEWRFAPAMHVGAHVARGQHIGWLGDSGNAETTHPHLHFEIRTPSGVPIDPWTSLRLATDIPAGTTCAPSTNPAPLPPNGDVTGYWELGGDGGVFPHGSATDLGHGTAFAVGMAPAPAGGYRSVTTAGTVTAFGAVPLGDLSGRRLTADVVGMAAAPAGDGYWLLGGDGGVFSFGSARFFGSTGAMKLNQPVVAMAATPSGRGYWLVARDGGVFSFGVAGFFGSTGGMRLNEPIVDFDATPTGRGYWLVARDGGIFAFGDATWLGSVPGTGSCGAIDAASITATPSGRGYWVQTRDGRVWAFGDAPDLGDAAGRSGVDVVDFAMLRA
jgi:hypothetical protein